jgi:predicted nucleic acid-binding protein
MENRLRLVIDTNVFLVSLAKKYKYYWLFEAIMQGAFDFCVSNEILHEYQEIIEKRYGVQTTTETLNF